MTNFEKVVDFTRIMGQPVAVKPTPRVPADVLKLRKKLITDEVKELFDELDAPEPDITKIAKEMADLLYVTYGLAVTFGIPGDAVFALVHDSNLTKLVDGKPVYNEMGKVMKGPNYKPPEAAISALLNS